MKKIIFCLVFSLPIILLSQNLNGRFSSSFYTFERFNSPTVSESFIRTFQSLNLNFNYDKISIRTRFNFETNIGNSLDSDSRLRFYNLYLEARDIVQFATIKLGRQPLFSTVAGGLFDGVNLKLKHSGFSLTGYYGGNVPPYQKLEFTEDFKNDYVFGGKFEMTALENFRLAVSYIDKNFKSQNYNTLRLDNDYDPITVLIQQKSNQYKFVSGELSYALNDLFEINSRYEYDLNYSVTSKIEFDGRVNVTDNLGFNVYYNYREPRVRYNSIFSIFNFGATQEIEGGVDYTFGKFYSLIGKFGYVKFEEENSTRLTIGASSNFGSFSYRKNLGFTGELDAVSLYFAHSLFDGVVTPSAGISYTNYKLDEESEANNILAILGGINLRPLTNLSFDFQGQFFDNKIYKNDMRLLLKVNYLFNTNF